MNSIKSKYFTQQVKLTTMGMPKDEVQMNKKKMAALLEKQNRERRELEECTFQPKLITKDPKSTVQSLKQT